MAFQVEELSIQLVELLVPLMPRIKQHDKGLADQLRRAATSVGLNVAEAAGSDPGQPPRALVLGFGQCARSEARFAASGGVALCSRFRSAAGAGAGEPHRRDSLANDARVARSRRC